MRADEMNKLADRVRDLRAANVREGKEMDSIEEELRALAAKADPPVSEAGGEQPGEVPMPEPFAWIATSHMRYIAESPGTPPNEYRFSLFVPRPESAVAMSAIYTTDQMRAYAESEAAPLYGKYGPVLRPFVSMMDAELHANAGKGDRPGWLSMSTDTCLLEIYYHLAKLQKAVRDDEGSRIIEHSADVANMAMMLVDICGGLSDER